jgi:hypothetical protein
MNIPTSRHLVFAALVLVAVLGANFKVHAQLCLDPGGGSDSSPGGDSGGSGDGSGGSTGDTSNTAGDGNSLNGGDQDTLDQGGSVNGVMEGGGVGGSGGNATAPDPINVTVNALTTVYDLSPTNVSSTAWTNSTPISLHSIEYINTDGSSGGVWTVNVAGGAGTTDSRSAGVNFPSPGTYYVRSGASTDGGNTWTYSAQVTVTVNDCMKYPTVSIRMLPQPGMEKWFTASDPVSKQFTVKYTNAQ